MNLSILFERQKAAERAFLDINLRFSSWYYKDLLETLKLYKKKLARHEEKISANFILIFSDNDAQKDEFGEVELENLREFITQHTTELIGEIDKFINSYIALYIAEEALNAAIVISTFRPKEVEDYFSWMSGVNLAIKFQSKLILASKKLKEDFEEFLLKKEGSMQIQKYRCDKALLTLIVFREYTLLLGESNVKTIRDKTVLYDKLFIAFRAIESSAGFALESVAPHNELKNSINHP